MSNLIFIHIPKAGGSTLHTIIEKQYKNNEIYGINGKCIDNDIQKFIKSPIEKKNKIKCLKGHMPFGLHKYFKNQFQYITMLRDPIERSISEYYYLKNKSKGQLAITIRNKNMDFVDYLNSNIAINVSNIQTRLIAGVNEPILKRHPRKITENDLNIAKKNLNNFQAFGLLEYFDLSILLFQKKLNWKNNILYTRQNTNKKKLEKEKINKSTIKLIIKRNKHDIALYEYAKLIFNNVTQKENNLEIKLKQFQKINKLYNNYQRIISTPPHIIQKIRYLKNKIL